MLSNSSLWPEIFFGIVAANVAVPVDTRVKEQQEAHVLRDSRGRLAFIAPEYYPLIREIEPHLPELKTVVVAGRPSEAPGGRVKWLAYSETVEGHRASGDARPSRPRPADQARLMLRKTQLRFPQEVGTTFQYDLQLFVISTHIQTSD